ncbi:hypothetical protein CSKR_104630 [Clonorchis sinensis]|uniref:Uncharacterized protein n=1 Tax=Clonorchis sinensis TaxID=79923 RepID=A0A3R7EQX0_CLOSI|nr:hypothetical protein CSKR_104630 [Clonorchis sinensis]
MSLKKGETGRGLSKNFQQPYEYDVRARLSDYRNKAISCGVSNQAQWGSCGPPPERRVAPTAPKGFRNILHTPLLDQGSATCLHPPL